MNIKRLLIGLVLAAVFFAVGWYANNYFSIRSNGIPQCDGTVEIDIGSPGVSSACPEYE